MAHPTDSRTRTRTAAERAAIPHPNDPRKRTLTTAELVAILTVIDRLPTLKVLVQLAQRRRATVSHLPALRVLVENGLRATREREALAVLLDRAQPHARRHAAARDLAELHRHGPLEFLSLNLANRGARRA